MRTAAERCKAMQEAIRRNQIRFLTMSPEDRMNYISCYATLSNYEQVALSQCKVHMSDSEKKLLREEAKKYNEMLASKQQQP